MRNLAAYLRVRLRPDAGETHAFAEEWESIRAYLEIEQIRFSDSLRIRHDVRGEALKARVPEMLVQPLVENAVTHGFREGGVADVCFSARREGDALLIRVENRGLLREDPASFGNGVGLRNVKERLRLLYGNSASFSPREDAGRVVAEITLPFEEADA